MEIVHCCDEVGSWSRKLLRHESFQSNGRPDQHRPRWMFEGMDCISSCVYFKSNIDLYVYQEYIIDCLEIGKIYVDFVLNIPLYSPTMVRWTRLNWVCPLLGPAGAWSRRYVLRSHHSSGAHDEAQSSWADTQHHWRDITPAFFFIWGCLKMRCPIFPLKWPCWNQKRTPHVETEDLQ